MHRDGDDAREHFVSDGKVIIGLEIRELMVRTILNAVLDVEGLKLLHELLTLTMEDLNRKDMWHDVLVIVHRRELDVGIVFQQFCIFLGDITALRCKLVVEPAKPHAPDGCEDVAHVVAIALCHDIKVVSLRLPA